MALHANDNNCWVGGGGPYLNLTFCVGLTETPTDLYLTNVDDSPIKGNVAAGAVVKVCPLNKHTIERDEEFAPCRGQQLIFTEQCAALIQSYWKDDQLPPKEFCIGGAAGTGKSCATKFLVDDIRRRDKDAMMFYYRCWDNTQAHLVHRAAKEQATKNVKTFVIADQMKTDNDAVHVSSMASQPNLFVIGAASSNMHHFKSQDEAQTHTKKLYTFKFSATEKDCCTLARLLLGEEQYTQFVSAADDEEEQPGNFASMLEPLGDEPSYKRVLWWTGKHLLSVAGLLKARNDGTLADVASKMVRTKAQNIQAFCNRAGGCPFYFAVIRMFRNNCTTVTGLEAESLDLRFTDPDGNVPSPLLFQALQYCLLHLLPPRSLFSTTFDTLRQRNVAENGFALEREALSNENMLKTGRALFSKKQHQAVSSLPIAFHDDSCLRMGYTAIAKLPGALKASCESLFGTENPDLNNVFFHAIPLDWNEKHIDALIIYKVANLLDVIAIQVTTEEPKNHLKSLQWGLELETFKSSLQQVWPGVDIRFSLVFVSGQNTEAESLQLDTETFIALEKSPLQTAYDYPLRELVGPSADLYLEQVYGMMNHREVRELPFTSKVVLQWVRLFQMYIALLPPTPT